jgi:hypothetical protein
MYLGLTPNLLYFLPDLSALYTLRLAPNFYEIHPWACPFNKNLSSKSLLTNSENFLPSDFSLKPEKFSDKLFLVLLVGKISEFFYNF